MAAAVGGAIVVATVTALCCSCSICEKKDDWLITDEVIANELGAGFLYKRGKSAAIWSKRYFTLTDSKMRYFLEQDRAVMKGEIVLAGAMAAVSSSRASSKKKNYFTITHPQCGSREFYAKSNVRRVQWIEKINDISAALSATAVYGKLYKQGGMSKNVWQERWCICAGPTLDYFESATDNQSKGSIELFGATVEELKVKDKFCFVVKPSAKNAKKKGDKRYVFAVGHQSDVANWVNAIRRQTTHSPPVISPNAQMNPLAPSLVSDSRDSAAEVPDDETGIAMQSKSPSLSMSMSSVVSTKPGAHSGYLEKKSPALGKGWQKRFFQLSSEGELTYFKTEEDCEKGVAPQGQIIIPTIDTENGLNITRASNELSIKIPKKTVHLRARSLEEIQEWHDLIESWAMYLNNQA